MNFECPGVESHPLGPGVKCLPLNQAVAMLRADGEVSAPLPQ